ncbi:polysaccharide biosynthesis protein [Pokkaliibacter plantistimulans]|uniref:Polysaccharide biosynthesis protein n=1 Tax=Proteobacteria bacterium 228 TaxID=2083153 RepID=A0A2S5KTV9_9PROT|nr:oligosaccharide flippase family protein [Pokkaliibacter plantistimulans]PPC77706.1 polysaccharide biosynthesis protein [Pokkaliibacter plantistimulans]
MSSNSSYLRHLLISMGTRIAMTVIRLLRNVLLARILGPADRGLFALLNALPELIAALTSGGLNNAVGYQMAQQRPVGTLASQILVYGCVAATLATLLGIVVLRQFGMQLDTMVQLGGFIWLLLLAVPLVVMKGSLLTLHNADGRVSLYNGMRLAESLAPLLLFLAMFWMWQDQSLQAALISWIGGLLFVAVVGWCWLKRLHPFRLQWDRSTQRELLSFSGKSHPGVLFQQMLQRTDYILIGLFVDSTHLGYYAMASAAVELLSIVPEAVTTPLMKRLMRQDQGMQQLTPFCLRVTGFCMLLACLLMALLGEWLITTLFGEAYRDAYPALLALLPGMFCNCYSSILRLDLLGKKRPGGLSTRVGIAAGFNLLLNLLMIPYLGIEGAAITSSLSNLLLLGLLLSWYCRLSGMPLSSTLMMRPSDLATLREMLRPAPKAAEQ